MSLAILASAATAYWLATANGGQLLQNLAASRGTMLVGLILWFVIPFIVSFQAMKRPTLSLGLLFFYSILSGFVFSTICLAYTGTTIFSAFVSASAIFISMSVYGLVTKKNLDKWGTQATAALFALIIAMVINIFLRSSMISFVFSIIAIVIFTVLTGYDTQKMKQMYNNYGDQVSTTGLAVFGALQLYLDFVNLFLQLLQIFGGNGNNRQ